MCRVTVRCGVGGGGGGDGGESGGNSGESSTDSFHVILSRQNLLGRYSGRMEEALKALCDSSFGERKGWKALPGQLPSPCMMEFKPVDLYDHQKQ